MKAFRLHLMDDGVEASPSRLPLVSLHVSVFARRRRPLHLLAHFKKRTILPVPPTRTVCVCVCLWSSPPALCLLSCGVVHPHPAVRWHPAHLPLYSPPEGKSRQLASLTSEATISQSFSTRPPPPPTSKKTNKQKDPHGADQEEAFQPYICVCSFNKRPCFPHWM